MNAIYVRRRSKVLVPDGAGSTPIGVLGSLQRNLEGLGYRLGPDVIERLSHSPPHRVALFYDRLVRDLRAIVGADRPFEPFYPNFPSQVMSASDAELYFGAIFHYATHDRPDFAKEDRPPLVEPTPARQLSLGDRDDFRAVFASLAASKVPYSEQDAADVRWFIAHYREAIRRLLPEDYPCKENLAVIAAALMRGAPTLMDAVDPHVRTATDVLRFAVALSGGDVSLATATVFDRFTRPERARMLGWIERAESRVDDMLRWKPRWIRLGERLHPGEAAKRYPGTAAAFDVLRNHRPHRTFNGWIEEGLERGDALGVLAMLHDRPGDVARRLDHLLRLGDDPDRVVARFADCADHVSTSVLLQMHAHFRRRDEPEPLRTFFPKGNVGKLYARRGPLPALAEGIAGRVVAVCEATLVDRFAKLPPLGRCYLDPRLATYMIPLAHRSTSRSLRTLARGSRVALPTAAAIRLFLWWRNGKGRVDVDLSAAMLGDDLQMLDVVAYYHLKTPAAVHSGDVIDAPRGASEFLDLDVSRCREAGVRYVVMILNSFSGQPYCDLPECFAGWMSRSQPDSGEVYDPRTVVDRVDLASDTTISIPAIFDLSTREMIWTDVALRRHPLHLNNVAGNLRGISLMVAALTSLRRPDLYTLFDLHVRARGERVDDPDAADVVFAVDRGLSPFDLDRIASAYL